MEGALAYIKWFAQPEVQKKWWSLGGYACHNAVLNDPAFPKSRPFAADFLKAMAGVQDFWQKPAYASRLQAMQKRLHGYVVADKGTAKQALDALIADWTATFKKDRSSSSSSFFQDLSSPGLSRGPIHPPANSCQLRDGLPEHVRQ